MTWRFCLLAAGLTLVELSLSVLPRRARSCVTPLACSWLDNLPQLDGPTWQWAPKLSKGRNTAFASEDLRPYTLQPCRLASPQEVASPCGD
jgi:hypothetical protein